MRADRGNTDDIEAIALRSSVLRAFSDTHRPSAAEMLAPDHLREYGPRNYGLCLHRVLTQYHWQEVQLANFRIDDDPLPFSSEIEQAEWARSVFELLSHKGVGYYAPAIILMMLKEGEIAQPLLIWLVERFDPDCWEEQAAERSFGHWSSDQIDIALRFFGWACEKFSDCPYREQYQAILSFWEARCNCHSKAM